MSTSVRCDLDEFKGIVDYFDGNEKYDVKPKARLT
jgi:hypothetical protein